MRSQFPKVDYWKRLYEGRRAVIDEGFTDGNQSFCIKVSTYDGASVSTKSFNDQLLTQLYGRAKKLIKEYDEGKMTWNTLASNIRNAVP